MKLDSFGLWLNYPFWKMADYLVRAAPRRTWRPMAHVLALGPIAICVVWREHRSDGKVLSGRNVPLNGTRREEEEK